MGPAAHLLADLGAMTVFGTLAFQTAVVGRAMRGLILASLVACLAGGLLWLSEQAAAFGAEVSMVLTATWFGRVMAAQMALVALGALLGGRAGLVLAGLGVAIGAARGHGAAMGDGDGLVVSHALHLQAAGAWLGSLPALFLSIRAGEDIAARRYARLGLPAVLLLAGTAAWQGWILGGGLPGLLGTAYGGVLGVKAALFAALLLLACLHHFRLVPALPGRRGIFCASILVEAGLGIGVLAAAVALSAMAPGMHEQPWWRFPWRPDGFAFADPDLRAEVGTGLALCALAAMLAVAGWWRHSLWLGVPVALWFGVPHLDLLFVPAYPTSYWQQPEPATRETVARGDTLYTEYCAACHGVEKRGDGPRARTLAIPPADLTAEHVWDHADGELFWWLTAGMPGPNGRPVMPGFGETLSEGDRWALIDAIRAANPHRRPAPVLGGHRHGGG